MRRVLCIGRYAISIYFTAGFGFYVETIPVHLRPALVDTDDDLQLIEYGATAFKFPFFAIEFGSYDIMDVEVFSLEESMDILRKQLEEAMKELEEPDDD